jgi:hypothetical protein
MLDRAQLLRHTHPGWCIWQSEAGRWWAADTRVTWPQIHAGCTATIDADDLDELARLLDEQATKRARLAASRCDGTTAVEVPGPVVTAPGPRTSIRKRRT